MIWDGGCYLVTDNEDGLTRVGFFVVRANGPGLIEVTGDPRVGHALVADCEASEHTLCAQSLGSGGVEGWPGWTTCGYACTIRRPARKTTWAAVKAQF